MLPNAHFVPGATVVTDAELYGAPTTISGHTLPLLASAISATDDSFTVEPGHGTRLPDKDFVVRMGTERIFVATRTADSCAGLVRGVDGTVAVAHVPGEEIDSFINAELANAFIVAGHYNRLAAEIIAIQTHLQNTVSLPNVTSQLGDPTGVGLLPTVVTALTVQAKVQVQIRRVSDGIVVYDSGEVTGLSDVVASSLPWVTECQIRARHKNTAGSWSPWSVWGNNFTTLWRPDAASVPSIQMWCRPDELTPDIDENGDLTVWRDQSGNGYDVVATTKPSVQVGTLNGQSVVDFASADRLATASIPRLHGVNATIFAVYRKTTGHAPALMAQWTAGNTAQRTATIHQNWNGDFYGDVGNVGANRLLKSSTFSVINAWEIVAIERWPTNGWVWLYGDLEIISTTLDSDVPTDLQPFNISLGFIGQIAEIIVCNAVVGTAMRQKIEGYLAHKFGLEALLYVNHPWKSVAP